ncbi:MAG: glycosyltransferase [Pseudonocardiaceae bacterium]
MNLPNSVSILVPARNEEGTLPTTLPTVLRAVSALSGRAEVVVIAPSSSPVHTNPPVRRSILRWVPTVETGKFRALQTGAAAADGDVLILVDADVMVEPDAFRQLLGPMISSSADIVAGRINVLQQAQTPMHRLLERWSSVSMNAWDLFRKAQPEFLWALPGAIYAIKRKFLPGSLLVPLVDDASIGLQAAENGATFAYAPDAVVRTPAPSTYAHWMRQKFRSRRGWAGLARLRHDEVEALERTFRRYLTIASADEPTSWLMHAQDWFHRLTARISIVLKPAASGAWKPARADDQWPLLHSTGCQVSHPIPDQLNAQETCNDTV